MRNDKVLDLSDLRRPLAPFCGHGGGPSIDPEPMIRMLIGGTPRHLYETVLRRCMVEALVGSEVFAFDAGIIKADPNRQHCNQHCKWSNSPN